VVELRSELYETVEAREVKFVCQLSVPRLTAFTVLPTVAERSQHVARALAVVLHHLPAKGLRIEDVAFLVRVLEVVHVVLEVVVVLSRNGRCRCSFAAGAGPVGGSRHGALEARRDTESLLAKALGLAHGLTPPDTGNAVVVALEVDGDVDLDEACILLDAQLGRLAVGGLGEGLVWRAVQVLEDVELLLQVLGRDVDIVLGDDGVVLVVCGHGGCW
jgi:hypothetical protein